MNIFSRFCLYTSMYCLGTAAYAQTTGNLVINGDFEAQKVSTLSGNTGNVKSRGTNRDELANWKSTTYASPDYFATNSPTGSDVNPSSTSYYGSFTPYHNSSSAHNGCLGLGTVSQFSYADTSLIYSEYATQRLSSPLLTSRTYYASMQVYRATVSEYVTTIGLDVTPTTPTDSLTYPAKTYTASGVGIQSPGYITAQQWTQVSGTFPGNGGQYINIGNFQLSNYSRISSYIPTPNPHFKGAYQYIDDVQIYPINIAGASVTIPCGASATIGENYTIPGASYSWSANPSAGSLPSTPQITVTPATTTTYTLTVSLPNQPAYSSQVTVTVGPLELPTIEINEVHTDRCSKYIGYVITNFSPNLTYTVNILSGRVMALPLHPTTDQFRIKGGAGVTGGSFSLTVSGCGNTLTTSEIDVSYDCDRNIRTANATTAYPNPATETIIIPDGAEKATLVNDKGKTLRTADSSGKLDVQNLPDGLYNLQMRQNGKLINQRIQVKH